MCCLPSFTEEHSQSPQSIAYIVAKHHKTAGGGVFCGPVWGYRIYAATRRERSGTCNASICVWVCLCVCFLGGGGQGGGALRRKIGRLGVLRVIEVAGELESGHVCPFFARWCAVFIIFIIFNRTDMF